MTGATDIALAPPISRAARPALPALTGVRALAALLAILWHASYYTRGSWLSGWHGYLGVDFFFILSGFILSYVHADAMARPDWRGWAAFLALRLGRIWPAYLVALGLTALPTLFAASARGELSPALRELALHAAMVQNWGLADPQAFNLPGWSVSAEWFVYILFPAFVMPASRLSPRLAAVVLPLPLIVLFLALDTAGRQGVNSFGLSGQLRAVCEFAMGTLAWRALRIDWMERLPWATIGVVAVVVWLAAAMALVPWSDADYVALMPAILLSLYFGKGPVAAFFAWSPIRFLGEISYSIYLVHWMMIWRLDGALRRWPEAPAWLTHGIVPVTIVIALSVAAGAALYFLVERPVRRIVRRRLGYAA